MVSLFFAFVFLSSADYGKSCSAIFYPEIRSTCKACPRFQELQNALDANQAIFRMAIEGSSASEWQINLENRSLYVGGTLLKDFNLGDHVRGALDADVPGSLDAWAARVHPHDHKLRDDALEPLLGGLTNLYRVKYRILDGDGNWRWVLSEGADYSGTAGKLNRLVGWLKDITEEKALEESLIKAKKDAEAVNDRIIDVWLASLKAIALERDNETGHHLERVFLISEFVLKELIENKLSWNGIPLEMTVDEKIAIVSIGPHLLARLIMLHDIGKMGIPDAILYKNGKLTYDEFTVMKTHAMNGERIAKHIEDEMEGINRNDALLLYALNELLRTITGAHHENYDGTGYPRNLVGTNIPFLGRLAKAVDVYDALADERRYKPAWPDSQIAELFRKSLDGNGEFDPVLAQMVIDLLPEFRSIIQSLHGWQDAVM